MKSPRGNPGAVHLYARKDELPPVLPGGGPDLGGAGWHPPRRSPRRHGANGSVGNAASSRSLSICSRIERANDSRPGESGADFRRASIRASIASRRARPARRCPCPRRASDGQLRPGSGLPRAGPAGPAARAPRGGRRRLRLRGRRLGRRTFHLGQERLHVVAGHQRLEGSIRADDVGPPEAPGDGRPQVRDRQVRLAAGGLRPGREPSGRGVARQQPGDASPIERRGRQGAGVRVRLRLQDLGRLPADESRPRRSARASWRNWPRAHRSHWPANRGRRGLRDCPPRACAGRRCPRPRAPGPRRGARAASSNRRPLL